MANKAYWKMSLSVPLMCVKACERQRNGEEEPWGQWDQVVHNNYVHDQNHIKRNHIPKDILKCLEYRIIHQWFADKAYATVCYFNNFTFSLITTL